MDGASIAEDPLTESHEASNEPPRRRIGPRARPWVALIANLFAAPMGHVIAGAALRGFLVWVAVNAVIIGLFWLVPIAPDRPLLVTIALAGLAALAILLGDAFVQARYQSNEPPRPYQRWFVYVGILLLIWVGGTLGRGIARSRVQAFRIPSESMRPTLQVGDFIFADKAVYARRHPRPGDLVVHDFPQDRSKVFVTRVIAVPGQTIEIRDKRVFVNGTELGEPYVVHTDPNVRPAGYDFRDNFGPHTVEDDAYFVMGDFRDNSNDSRYFGAIPADHLVGRIALIYWSWEMGRGARWGRIGTVPH